MSSHPNAKNAPHSIVPVPAGKQIINNDGATSSAKAISEAKTYSACNTRYNDNSKVKPADRRAKLIVQQYSNKFKKLDRLFSSEMVPVILSGLLRRHNSGSIVDKSSQYVCFGEINEMIRPLAKEASSGDDGLKISPLINTDRKGGALPIMLQQFRRAIRVPIVSGNAKHKLTDCIVSGLRHERQQMYAGAITAITDGNRVKMAERDNSVMGMTSEAIKTTSVQSNTGLFHAVQKFY